MAVFKCKMCGGALEISNNTIDFTRFGVVMPGETVVKSVGEVSLSPKLEYAFENSISSKDIKTFADYQNKQVAKDTQRVVFCATK